MNENINLCKILKGHEGKTFYSPCFGKSILNAISDVLCFQSFNANVTFNILSNGTYCTSGEICIFPSKDQRDWNKWIEEQKTNIPKTWNELVTTNKANSHCIHTLNDTYLSSNKSKRIIEKSALALLKIHKLIEVGYGGNVTDEEWKEEKDIYYIYPGVHDKFYVDFYNTYGNKCHVAFHTKKQAEEFLNYPENVQLLRDYFMINE